MKFSSTYCVIAISLVLIAAAHAQDQRESDKNREIVLFDGKDTDGWKMAGPGDFELEDGVLTSHGGMGLFWHEREFQDFTLLLEYKVSQKGDNSGIFLRFPDPGDDPWVAVHNGYEVQIHDTAEKNRTGSIYDFQESKAVPTKPAGQWNQYEITVIGQKYTVKLNGEVINEFTGDRNLKGHIGIQNHDDHARVSFRNIRVIEHEKGEKAAPPRTDARQLQPGLVGEYFIDRNTIEQMPEDLTPFLVRVDAQVNFRATQGEFYGTKLANDFVVRWTGIIRVETPGQYTFGLRSDDGSRLYIGDNLVIDNVKGKPMELVEGKAELPAGDHPIRIEFGQGSGGAGIILSWKRPGDEKLSAVPAKVLFHDPSREIAWDRARWDEYVWDKKAWRQKHAPIYARMDYGSMLGASIVAQWPANNTTNKGIAIWLDQDRESGVVFDTETMRYAAGWTGEALELKGVVFDGSHGTNPIVTANQLFGAAVGPGWANADGSFDDPRERQLGPMPKQWAKYKGLYRHGEKIVLSYTINGTDVLELPAMQREANHAVFTRTIQVPAGEKPLTLVATEQPSGENASHRVVVKTSDGLEIREHNGRTIVTIPPRRQMSTYVVAICSDNPAAVVAAEQAVAQKQDLGPVTRGGEPRWTPALETKGHVGTGSGPYVIDTLTVPEQNPWNSWMRFGGLDFFSDGRAALCTWSGDVWIVSGIDDKLEKLTWKRYAAGLFQALGLRIVNDKIYVLGRDQITRLHDMNGDGEADFYENFNSDVIVTPSFHEFALDLQTDLQGNFYFAKGGAVRPGGRGWETISPHHGTVLRVAPDGGKLDVFATGVRAPNGMGAGPDGTITVADNQGTWTPVCRLNIAKAGSFLGVTDLAHRDPPPTNYEPPICWFPMDVDNSSGGQVWVTTDKWGPFTGKMLHMSYGQCALFRVLVDEVDGQVQGGVVKFALDFDTGICRARFHPIDEQLYVTGLRGWQTRAARDGALQRVRYTGKPVHMPDEMRIIPGGIAITFTTPLDPGIAADTDNYSIEQWNYLWSSEYGSEEYSVADPTKLGRDPVHLESVEVSPDNRTITLKIPDLKPVMQMKISMRIDSAEGDPINYDIINTVNKIPTTDPQFSGGPAGRVSP
jgi:hypothetical protein